jgi:hypothetical protein
MVVNVVIPETKLIRPYTLFYYIVQDSDSQTLGRGLLTQGYVKFTTRKGTLSICVKKCCLKKKKNPCSFNYFYDTRKFYYSHPTILHKIKGLVLYKKLKIWETLVVRYEYRIDVKARCVRGGISV